MRNERMSRGWHLDTGQFITESRARQYAIGPLAIYSNLFLHTFQYTSLRLRTLLVSSLLNHNAHQLVDCNTEKQCNMIQCNAIYFNTLD